MSKKITFSCNKCELYYKEEELTEAPIIIGFYKHGHSKYFYRRNLFGYGDHLCKNCAQEFVEKLNSLIEEFFTVEEISDYESIG